MLLPGEVPKRAVGALEKAQIPKLQTSETGRRELPSKETTRREDSSAGRGQSVTTLSLVIIETLKSERQLCKAARIAARAD